MVIQREHECKEKGHEKYGKVSSNEGVYDTPNKWNGSNKVPCRRNIPPGSLVHSVYQLKL